MTAHIHAASMLQYAQDATETDWPWERWECAYSDIWITLVTHPNWECTYQYRRKPKVILINGHNVPEPMRVAPEDDTIYYVPSLILSATANSEKALSRSWVGFPKEYAWLSGGLIHYTKEAAELHGEALLSFTRSDK